MNEPNKIYFEIDSKGPHTYIGLQPNYAKEYIRKDTLLEWAKEQLPREKSEYGFSAGYIDAYEEMIKKIESL